MSKRVRTLVISLITVVLLVGLLLVLLFVVPNKDAGTSSAATSSDTSITLLNKTTDSSGNAVSQPVSKISVKTKTEQFVLSPNKDGQMAVEAYNDLLINTNMVSALSSDMAKMTVSSKVADSADNLADYGLDAPLAVLDVTYSDGTAATFTVGSLSPLKTGYYFQMKGDNAVYMLSKTNGDEFIQGSTKYIGTAVITAPAVNSGSTSDKAVVRDMKLTGTVRASKPFAFRLRADTDDSALSSFDYIITSPVLAGFDSTNTTVTSATSLTATDVVKAHPTAEDLKTYGLDNPYSVCEMSLAVQNNTSTSSDTSSTSDTSSASTAKSPTLYNVAQHTVKLGGKNASGSYYAMIDNYNVVYLVSDTSVPWSESTFIGVVSKVLFYTKIDDVSSITVNTADKNTTFALTHNPDETDTDKKLTVTVDGNTMPTADFRTLYQVFMLTERYDDTDQKPSGNPDVTFTMNMTDPAKKPFVAKFYKMNASLYLCSIQGGETFSVKVSSVENMLTQVNNYLNGQAVTN